MPVLLNTFKGMLGKVPISETLGRAGGRINRVKALANVIESHASFAPKAGAMPLANMRAFYQSQAESAGASSALADMSRFAMGRIGSHAAVGAGIGAGLNVGQHMMFGDQYGNRSGRGAFRSAVRGGLFGATMGAGVGAGRMAFGRSSGYMEHLAARARAVPKIAQVSRGNIMSAARDYQDMIGSVVGRTV